MVNKPKQMIISVQTALKDTFAGMLAMCQKIGQKDVPFDEPKKGENHCQRQTKLTLTKYNG